MTDWAQWAAREQVTTDQCARAAESLAEGWSDYFLAGHELGGGLTLSQLRSLQRELSAPAWASRDAPLDWSQWSASAAAGRAEAGDPLWIAAVGDALLAHARLAGVGRVENGRELSRCSARDILDSELRGKPGRWEAAARRLGDALARRLPRLPKGRLVELIDAARPAADRVAWGRCVAAARQQILQWAQAAVVRALRERGCPWPMVAVASEGARIGAVAVDARGDCQQVVEQVEGLTVEQLQDLCRLVDARHVCVALGEGAGAVVRQLAQWADTGGEVSWRLVHPAGAAWWSKSLAAIQAHGDCGALGRQALFLARRVQDPLAMLAEAPARELAPAELAPLLSDEQCQRLERVIDDEVHEQTLNVRRAGPRAASRLCAVPPLRARRAWGRASRVEWPSLDALAEALELSPRQVQQTRPFIRLDDPPPRAADGQAPDASQGAGESSEQAAPEQAGPEQAGPEQAGPEQAGPEQAGPDPQAAAALWRRRQIPLDELSPGQRLAALVIEVTDFGAFVDIGARSRALIHIAELSSGYLADPLQSLAPGDALWARLAEVDVDKRRVDARLAGAEAPARDRRSKRGGESPEARRRPPSKRGAGRGKPTREKKRPEPEAPATPITDEMAEGKAPLRSFSDLLQFYDRKRSQEDSSS